MSKIVAFISKYERNITLVGLLFFAFLAIATLFSSLNCDCVAHEKTTLYDIKTVDVINRDGTVQTVGLPKSLNVDDSYDIIVDIAPYIGNKHLSIMTSFSYCNVAVYADNQLIYQLKKHQRTLSKSGGYQVVIFDLPDDLKNPTITMRIEPMLSHINFYNVSKILLGRKCDIIINMIKTDGLTIIIASLLILNCFVVLIMAFRKKDFIRNENYRIFHLSILGFLVAVYFLTQLWTVNYFLASFKEFIYFSEYMSLFLVLVPASLYISSKLDPKFNKVFSAIVIVLLFNTITQFTLTLLKIIEFKEMIFITHGFMYVSLLYIFAAIIFTDGKKYPSKHSLILPMIAIIIATFIPLLYYLFFRILIFKLIGPIITISIIVLETMEIYVKYTRYKEEKIEKDIYKKMATTDSLTGLANRQAHNACIEKIESEKIAGWILSIDINSLKYINDKYGHSKGDKLIIDFAKLLKTIQEENRQIHPFRIGGDEFFLFIEVDNCFDINSLISRLKESYSRCNGFEAGFIPTFSVGYHYYDPTMNDNVISVYNIADKLMYDDKTKYKKDFRSKKGINDN